VKFSKYHALGNDYIVLDPSTGSERITPGLVQRLCHRHYGLGADGVLIGPLQSTEGDVALRIFNPDGEEAEKSGNGLRIFARHLWEKRLIRESECTVSTPGGVVRVKVHPEGRAVTVEMGIVSFHSSAIPVTGPPREVVNEQMSIGDENFTYSAATIGNPHCVILTKDLSVERVRRLGPLIERNSRFPKKTNVQFLRVIDRSHIQIEIWERGAGYTLASGSSSCASAAVARRLGLCDPDVSVRMPGGVIDIHMEEDWSVTMTGPVEHIADGTIAQELLIATF
jgi:diaminopimelate epimerase